MRQIVTQIIYNVCHIGALAAKMIWFFLLQWEINYALSSLGRNPRAGYGSANFLNLSMKIPTLSQWL
jgi:hypothetical protein